MKGKVQAVVQLREEEGFPFNRTSDEEGEGREHRHEEGRGESTDTRTGARAPMLSVARPSNPKRKVAAANTSTMPPAAAQKRHHRD